VTGSLADGSTLPSSTFAIASTITTLRGFLRNDDCVVALLRDRNRLIDLLLRVVAIRIRLAAIACEARLRARREPPDHRTARALRLPRPAGRRLPVRVAIDTAR